MNKLKYLIQFIFIIFLFTIFKFIGIKFSRIISGKIFVFFGSLFRSNKISFLNISNAFPNMNISEREKLLNNMWINYGKIFAEYIFIKKFREESFFTKNIFLKKDDELLKIKKDNKPVIFISGHFNNFELMAMSIEKSGIDLAAYIDHLIISFLIH